MPLEINEIGIRMRVRDGSGAESSEDSGSSEGGCGGGEPARSQQDLVDECVRRVLRILKARQER